MGIIKVIDPIDLDSLLLELDLLTPILKTNRGGNLVYITDANSSPNIMKEIARLREVSFRTVGGGTGHSLDLDLYDNNFKQLFVWDPQNKQIAGAYRFALMKDLLQSPTSHLFNLQQGFKKEIQPFAIELGRSFVNFDSKKKAFALHNLWDGLAYLAETNPEVKYFFGKVTFYPKQLGSLMDVLLEFLDELYKTNSQDLVIPKEIFNYDFSGLFSGKDNSTKQKMIEKIFAEQKTIFPPLLKSYMSLSNTMQYYGCTINSKFGEVVEGGILVTIADINPEVLKRHKTH